MAKNQRTEGGFTLAELMVVIVVIGVLGAVAMVNARRDPTPNDAARLLSGKLNEVSRLAAMRRPLDPAVVDSTGDSARAQFTLQGDQILIEIAEENADLDNYDWVVHSHVSMPRGIVVSGVSNMAAVDQGYVPANPLGTAELFSVKCYEDGRCCYENTDCEAVTLFIEGKGKLRARVVLMPLGGTSIKLEGW